VIENAQDPAHHEKGTDPTHYNDPRNDHQKTQTRDFDAGPEDTVDLVENGINGVGSDGQGRQDDQSLEKVVQYHFVDEPAKGPYLQGHIRSGVFEAKGIPTDDIQKISFWKLWFQKKFL
jgi:hypothetical protein